MEEEEEEEAARGIFPVSPSKTVSDNDSPTLHAMYVLLLLPNQYWYRQGHTHTLGSGS